MVCTIEFSIVYFSRQRAYYIIWKEVVQITKGVLFILLKSGKKLSNLVCVFVYALIVFTLLLPATKIDEKNQTALVTFDNNLITKANSSQVKGHIKENVKPQKKIIKKNSRSLTVDRPKVKPEVKPVVKPAVVKIKTSPSSDGKVLLLPFGINVFSSADYEKMLQGTGLDGYGNTFKNMELKYGVNGLFAMGVALHESALGNHPLSGNNYFGMIGMHFDSTSDNIFYFGHLLSGGLYEGAGLTTIPAINDRYASDPNWATRVLAHMVQRAHMVS